MNPVQFASLLFGTIFAVAVVVYLASRLSKRQGEDQPLDLTVLKDRLSQTEREIAELNQKLRVTSEEKGTAAAAASRVPVLEAQILSLQQENATHQAASAEARTRLEEARKTAEEKLALLSEAQGKLSDAFKAVSGEALASNNQAFLDLANATLAKFQEGAKVDLESKQKAIDETLKPLKDSLDKVDSKIQELEKSRESAYLLLTDQVKSLTGSQIALQGETLKLVTALRSPATRGRWGELQLRRVVEMAGMVNRCDFTEQQSVETEEGRLRPDMVVNLPCNRRIVVDSKVPMLAYLEALDATDEPARLDRLKQHAAQVRTHIGKLAERKYWQQFEPTPEYVVAFLPGESCFSAALEQDPELIEYAAAQRVVLATPTTLIALLKAVSYGWQQQDIAAQAHKIGQLGAEIYDRVGTLTEYFCDLGRSLNKSVQSYNRACGTLESRVLVSARKLKEHAIQGEKDLKEPRPIDRSAREPEQVQAPAAVNPVPSTPWPAVIQPAADVPEAIPVALTPPVLEPAAVSELLLTAPLDTPVELKAITASANGDH